MGKLIFVTGGSRSGKSSLATALAEAIPKRKIFIATCVPKDGEMKRRIILHRKNRPSSWETIEARDRLVSVLKEKTKLDIVIIIDCLTLFISWLIMKKVKEDKIEGEVKSIVKIIKDAKATVVIVSNEVGCGLVPESKLGRDFRDIAGICNQIVAKSADEVTYMVCGMPLKIKYAE